jgi:hypothetical protein
VSGLLRRLSEWLLAFGVALAILAMGVLFLNGILTSHRSWSWDLMAVGVVALVASIWGKRQQARIDRELAEAEAEKARKTQEELDRASVAVNLYLSANAG